MIPLLATLSISLVPQGGGSNAPVVINEFSYDDSGVDDREFVELYNRSGKSVDISGWTLDSRDGSGPNSSFKIPANTVLPPRGFWVLGAKTVPNVNQVVGTTDIWENSDESLTLRDAKGAIVDTLIYEQNKNASNWGANLREGQGIWGNLVNTDASPMSWSRLRDGYDTDNNGRDFRMAPETPGKSNNLKSLLTYVAVFDNVPPDRPVPQWSGSFKPPHAVDPTKISNYNPKVLSASPQKGHAAAMWDPTGGGNHCVLLTDSVADVILEAYVHFDAGLEKPGEVETWSLGVQGTSATFYNTPDPLKRFGFRANGNTGVVWTYQVTDKNAKLFLVDHGDGGTDFRVLGSIDLKKGVHDGWQRLRLQVSGDRVDGFFSGTFGAADGIRISGKLSHPGPGGIWVGYREALSTTGDHPFLCDLLTIRAADLSVTYLGKGVATTRGTPTIDVTGLPMIGFQQFGIRLGGLVPSGQTLLVIGAGEQKPPLDLSKLGGQPGSMVYVTLDASEVVPVDTKGEALFRVPIPNNPSLRGRSLYWQDFDLDRALRVPLPFGNSRGMRTILGG